MHVISYFLPFVENQGGTSVHVCAWVDEVEDWIEAQQHWRLLKRSRSHVPLKQRRGCLFPQSGPHRKQADPTGSFETIGV